ncbi:CoA-binding protein [Chloroflexota bacterium]
MGIDQQVTESLRVFFEADGTAIVCASRTPGKSGNNILKNLELLGYQGTACPVNPRASEINGLRCYLAMSSIPGDVEPVIVSVPVNLVMTPRATVPKRGCRGRWPSLPGSASLAKRGAGGSV